jgi:hypothetical protein
MSKKKIKVSEATNAQLDWLVAKIEGDDAVWYDKRGRAYERSNWDVDPLYKPTTNWSQMGPIIEREEIAIVPMAEGWEAQFEPSDSQSDTFLAYGPTPLIAAARCYVASKLGEEVEVPEELV